MDTSHAPESFRGVDGTVLLWEASHGSLLATLQRHTGLTFDAMPNGWRAQMLARGLAIATLKARSAMLPRDDEGLGQLPT